jgi:hypothetical protein
MRISKAKKIHYGHYTLGRALCGRKIICNEALTRKKKDVTCEQCHRALG